MNVLSLMIMTFIVLSIDLIIFNQCLIFIRIMFGCIIIKITWLSMATTSWGITTWDFQHPFQNSNRLWTSLTHIKVIHHIPTILSCCCATKNKIQTVEGQKPKMKDGVQKSNVARYTQLTSHTNYFLLFLH